jgi:hypothetical protein
MQSHEFVTGLLKTMPGELSMRCHKIINKRAAAAAAAAELGQHSL